MATSVPTIGGKNILDPGPAWEQALEQDTPGEFYIRANSYTCPLGARPGSAWLLMLRRDLDELDKNAFHELQWDQVTDAGALQRLTIPSLSIVRSLTQVLARPGDVLAAQLVELQDKRRQLRMSSIDSQYNVRIPAPSATSGTGLYYTDSLNGGALWTWQTLVTNIWDDLPTTAGSAPTLPYTPDGTPEGFRFIAENAWDALHEVLKKISCTTSYDPIADTFSYIRLGTTQAGLAASVTAHTRRLMYDYDPGDDYQLANMPETVRVFFQRRELYHGIERDTPDASNWEMTPVVSKDRATGIAGAAVGTVMNVGDDLPAEFDDTGVNSNSAALQTRADEVGDNVRDRIDVSEERSRRQFQGLITDILPGSEISKVRWRDYGEGGGLRTEIFNVPTLDDDVLLEPENGGGRRSFIGEKFQTPDLDRATHPLWPRLPQPVRVDDGSSATAATLDPNSDGLFPGFVRRWANGGWTSLDACWIRPVDLQGDNEDTVAKLRQLDTLIGRLSGVETSESSTRPVYLVREGGSGKGAPIGTVWGGVLAPVQHTDGKYYIDRNGQPDTDWAFMDGVSNASPGSGVAAWDRLGTDQDSFFIRAKDSIADADDTAFGRTVPFGDPNADIVLLQDHTDHSHESLGLCNAQYQLGTGGDPRLCAYPASGSNCETECTGDVQAAGDCGSAASDGVLGHTFDNGQGPDVDPVDILMTPPNKAWHWFERIAETGAIGVTPFQFVQTSQPMAPLPEQPIATGAVYQDDGSP